MLKFQKIVMNFLLGIQDKIRWYVDSNAANHIVTQENQFKLAKTKRSVFPSAW